MDILSLLKTGSSMAWTAFLGDFIHDFVERKRDTPKSASGGETLHATPKNEKVKPFLGLAILSHEEEYRFTRTFEKLTGDEQSHLAEFLLEYYIRPSQNGGFLTKIASFWQYDQFLLLTVNRDSSSKSTGSARINTVETTEAPGTVTRTTKPTFGANGKAVRTAVETDSTGTNRKTVTTDETKDFYTPGGTESVTFLKAMSTYYRDGGMGAAEDYLRLNKMPTMDPDALKKVEDFLERNFGKVMGWLEAAFGFTKDTIVTYIPKNAKAGYQAFMKHSDIEEYNKRREARTGFFGKLSRIFG